MLYRIPFVMMLTFIGEIKASDWNHNKSDYDNGPPGWWMKYPTCNGQRQSPIQIRTHATTYDDDLEEFQFKGYDEDNAMLKLKNNGHGAVVEIVSNNPGILGGGLGENTYILKQFHFHTGRDNGRGSEHLVDGDYAGELHFVHYLNYLNEDNVLDVSNGVAVLGVLIKAESGPDHPGYDKIIKYMDRIRDKDTETMIESFPLEELLPEAPCCFYRYNGSLTTPPCSEAVVWTIFKSHVTLSEEQVEKFRELKGGNGKELLDTHRPIVPINERMVTTSFHPENPPKPEPPSPSSATSQTGKGFGSIYLLIFTVAVYLTW